MKNVTTNKKSLLLIMVFTIVLVILLMFVMTDHQSVRVNAKAKEKNTSTNDVDYLNETVFKMFGKKISKVDTWYNLDDTPEYLYIEFCDSGYAVFYKTLELLEYSNSGRYIDVNAKEKVYYTGPANVFYKKNNSLQNILTGENKKIISEEATRTANNIRHKFLKKEAQINIGEIENTLNAHQAYSIPKIDEDQLIVMDINAETYIENRSYFLSEPYHGYNEHGTCGSVAAQLLLGYNNYYIDRRIITNEFLFTNSSNPNMCSDPMFMSSRTLGSNNEYYNYIIGKVEPTALNCKHTTGTNGEKIHSHKGSSCTQVKNGLRSILNERGISCNTSGTVYSTQLPVNIVTSSIDNDNPLIISLSEENGGINHWVVAYGYRNYTYPNNGGTYTGYITHFGWTDCPNVWVNSSWCNGYVSLDINHIHDYSEYIGGEYHEVRCSGCGHRKYAFGINYLSIDEVEIGQTEFDIEGFIRLPNYINGHTVTKIGDNAFNDQTELTGIRLPSQLKVIGDAAFNLCTSLTSITIPKTVVEIGEAAFSWTTSLSEIIIPESVNKIAPRTFGASGITKFTAKGKISQIGTSAFVLCGNLKSVYLQPNMIFIEESAFQSCHALASISLLGYMTCIKDNAFLNCNNLTIFLEKTKETNFEKDWNPSNRPVVFGCSREDNVITSFVKTTNNPINANAENGILNPKREGYAFGGWYTSSNYSGTKYMNIATAPNATLYAKWEPGTDDNLTGEGGACVSEGSMITLADGSQKAVETLTGDEMLMVWDLFNGTFSAAPILFIDSDPIREYKVIILTFADGTEVEVIDEHGFWNVDLNEYVFLRADAAKYIGNKFNKQTFDANGNMINTAVELVSVRISTEYTTAWSPVTYGHLCYYVNGMLSMPGATTGLINIFEVDPNTMTIDEEQYLADIAEYGLFTYKEFAEIIAIPEEVFNAFNGQYLKVAIGKKLINLSAIAALVERYSTFFESKTECLEEKVKDGGNHGNVCGYHRGREKIGEHRHSRRN